MKVSRFLMAAVLALLPALITSLVIGLHLRADLFTFIPDQPNDQSVYWHHILTFSKVGFNGGYYSPDEKIAQASFAHFGPHGPLFPALYGTIAHFTGWQTYSGLLVNMALVAGALLLFVYLAQLDHRQILLAGVALATFWPLLLYLATIMQESFHQAVAVVLAGLFYRLITRRGIISWRFYVGLLLFLLVVSNIRISWALLFLPFFLLTTQHRTPLNLLRALAQSVVCIVVVLMLSRLLSAPTNHSVFETFSAFRLSILDGVNSVLRLLGQNIQQLFVLYTGFNIYLAQTLQIVALIGVYGIVLCAGWLKRPLAALPYPRDEALLHVLNLSAVLLAGLTLYLADGFERVFAPHLLFSLLVMVALRRYRLVGVVIALNVLSVGSFLDTFTRWQPNFRLNKAQIAAAENLLSPYLVYDFAASQVWCNTLLTDTKSLNYRVINVPAGIGISYILNLNILEFPLKSHYLLLSDDVFAQIRSRVNVTPIAVYPTGTLYQNRDADCYGDTPHDLMTYAAQTQKPVYLPLNYLKAADAPNRAAWSQFAQVRVSAGETLPPGLVVVPPEGLYGLSAEQDRFIQYALLLPDTGETVILPPLPASTAESLLAQITQAGETLESAWLLGRQFAITTENPFAALPAPPPLDMPLALYDDTLELVHVAIPREMQPGAWLPVTLYWRVRQTTPRDYFAYVQLWDYAGGSRSEIQPGTEGILRGFYPTSRWKVGEIYPEARWLRLYDDAPPGAYRLMVSVYTQPHEIFAAVAGQNDSWAAAARPVVPVDFPAPDETALPLDARLGDNLRLTHYSLEPGLLPGAAITLKLFWETSAPLPADYVIFVHVRGGDGALLAQQDAPPEYPTGSWGVGEQVMTSHTLQLPLDLPPNTALWVGLYSLPDVMPLPVAQDGQMMPENAVRLR